MLILASNSPRRKELLASFGLEFMVMPAHLDESLLPGEAPDAYVLRLAAGKAGSVRARLDSREGDAWILAADTTVAVDGDILGKPVSHADAAWMLCLLRGRAHQVYTGLVLIRADDGATWQESCITDVLMRQYSEAEMQAYIASGDPLDKAGAYAIQHTGFSPVSAWEGCYANVVGLPLCRLARMMARANYPFKQEPKQACQKTLGETCLVYQEWLNRVSNPPIPL